VNARAEAAERLGGRFEVRVLEPSPPAVEAPPWFADDPAARGDVPEGRVLVSPVSTGDRLWDELASEDPELARWCAERWLGAYRRLGPAPERLVPSRLALHRLAEHVISPARRAANTKIGLRYTRGGFGTPFFGDGVQLRVAGTELVRQRGDHEQREQITTVAAAARLAGVEGAGDEAPLELDPAAAAFIGDWFGFAASVLEELRARADTSSDASRVQLWPEHFDMAVELGSEDAGARAAYGLSPGDANHPEPYGYVAPWSARPTGELWQATGFSGAELPFAALLEASDQRSAALEFFGARLSALSRLAGPDGSVQ